MSVSVGLKKAATLCILRSKEGFLLLRRNKEPHFGNYIPIGGRLEKYETPREAAIREVMEETGIVIEEVRLRGIMTETSPTKFNWINYIYTSEISATTPGESPEGTLEWVEKERLNQIPTPRTDLFIYDYVSRSRFFVFDAIYDRNLELIRLLDELSGTVLHGAD